MRTDDRTRASRGLALASLLLAFSGVAGCGEGTGLIDEIGIGASVEGSPVLRFAAVPDEKRRRFAGVAATIEESLGVSAEYVPSSSDGATVDMFRSGDIHFAWFGGLSGVQAREAVPGARAIAQGVEDSNVHSYFIAHRATGLLPSTAFPMGSRGLRFSFGSERSTSGRLMPERFIRQATGQAPGDFYTRVGFSGSDAETLALVNAGSFDVGALNHRVYDAATPDEKARTIILWMTPSYADYHLRVRPDLDDQFRRGFTDDLQEVLLALPQDLCERAFSRSGLIAVSDDQFEGVEEIARSVGLVR